MSDLCMHIRLLCVLMCMCTQSISSVMITSFVVQAISLAEKLSIMTGIASVQYSVGLYAGTSDYDERTNLYKTRIMAWID